jgi:hypothetical protein
LLAVVVAHDEAGVQFFDRPRPAESGVQAMRLLVSLFKELRIELF